METIIKLEWKEPRNVLELNNLVKERLKGVYIWGFNIEYFVPYYIGISNDIIYRLFEHLNNLIGGRYTIFHKNSLCNFAKYKNQGLQKDKTEGKIYIPDWPSSYIDFLNERKDKENFQDHLDFMIDNFAFSYAIPDDKTKNNLEEIEKRCIYDIKIEKLANTKAGIVNKDYKIVHSGSIKKIFN